MTDTPEGPGDAAPAASPAPSVTLQALRSERGDRVGEVVARCNSVLHFAACTTMVALLAWTVTDIVGRSAFNSPVRGTVEVTELAVVVLVYLGLARVESDDGHISVDLLYVRLGRRGQLVMRAVAGLIGVVIVAAMTWRLYVYAGTLEAGGFTTGILRIPLQPVALLAVAGAAAFALTMVTNLLLVVRALVRGG